MKKIIFILTSLFILNSCEEVKNFISNSDNVAGLKEALVVGTNNATSMLGKPNGYLNDAAVKILLPQEAQTTFKALQFISENVLLRNAIKELGGIDLGSNFQNTLITAFNMAAEDAAPEAAGVFIDAIKNMTFTDATSILFTSNQKAATEYLETKTYSGLQEAFSPIINNSLSSVKVGDFTVVDIWDTFAKENNKLAGFINNSVVKDILQFLPDSEIKQTINSVKQVETNLGGYVTGKALDGIFTKVAVEEANIRTNADARVSDLLQRVFGQLD